MSKIVKFYISLMVLLFIGIAAIELTKELPVNWTPTYNEKDKIPYGTYVLYNELETLFPHNKIQDVKVTPYEYFNDFYDDEDSTYLTTGTYLKINTNVNIDEVSLNELLNFTAEGNTLFLSSNYFPRLLKDSLNFETENEYNFEGKSTFTLANSTFKRDSISLEKSINNIYFSELDSINTTVLGYQKFNNETFINYVKVNYKQGNIFLHLQPIAFTNYNLLKGSNNTYVASVLSYLEDDTIFYDSANKKGGKQGGSPMRFILNNPPLKYAWYLLLITLLLFMIFNAKRKQRVIKTIKPNENTTIAFTKTIGNLYYETKDHNNLIDKKITYFLEHIRRVYYLDTQLLDDKFTKALALKSGTDKIETKKLINKIVHLRAKKDCSEIDLIELNKAIEDFYNI